jgi:hypothetical protein
MKKLFLTFAAIACFSIAKSQTIESSSHSPPRAILKLTEQSKTLVTAQKDTSKKMEQSKILLIVQLDTLNRMEQSKILVIQQLVM